MYNNYGVLVSVIDSIGCAGSTLWMPLTQHQPVRPFAPEFRLLVSCCRPPCEQQEIEPLLQSVQWSAIAALAEKHGVVPNVYRALSAYSAHVPIWLELESLFLANSRRALWLTELMNRVLDVLQSRGITALPYKGPVLAQLLYGDIAARQYADLDILIRAADFEPAKKALGDLGLTPHLPLTPVEQDAYLASGYECPLDGYGAKNIVEMQWRILPGFYAVDFDTDIFFQRAVVLDFCGKTVHSLSNEDLFLVLCVHAAKHLWGRLSWIYDIAQLSVSASIDWNLVREYGCNVGIERIVGISSDLAHTLFGFGPPISRETVGEAGQKSISSILARLPAGEQPDTESRAYFREVLRTRERWSDRVKFLFRLATTPSVGEWRLLRLPPPLFPAYRAVRAFRLLGKLL